MLTINQHTIAAHVNESPRGRSIVRWLIVMCVVASALEFYDITCWGVVVPKILATNHWNLTAVSLGSIGSLAVLGMLFGALFAGVAGDLVGRKGVLITAVGVFSVAMALSALAPNVGTFAAARFITGLGSGALMPTVAALVFEYSRPGRAQLNVAIAYCGIGLGGAASALIGTFVVQQHDFRWMFWIGAAPAVLLVPAIITFAPESLQFLMRRGRVQTATATAARLGLLGIGEIQVAVEEPKGFEWSVLLRILDREHLRATLLFWVASFCCLLVLFGTNTWLPGIMTQSGYSLGSALAFSLVLNVSAALVTLPIAWLSDVTSPKNVVAACMVLAAIGLVALGAHVPLAAMFILVGIIGVGSIGSQVLLNALIGSYYRTENRATALGAALTIGRVGGVIGPTIGAAVVSAHLSLEWSFSVFALPALVGGVLIVLLPKSSEAGSVHAKAQAGGSATTTEPAGSLGV